MVALPVRDALDRLPVRVEDRTGYERSEFRHRIDADKDGCDTWAEVPKAEAVIAPVQEMRCALTGGEWHPPYGDRYLNGASGLDIDHLVFVAVTIRIGLSAVQNVSAVPPTIGGCEMISA